MWISVKDKLPTLEKGVLITNGDSIYIGELWVNDDEKYWVEHFEPLRLHNITHWQPLPPLPQDENLDDGLDKICTEDDLTE